MKATQSAEQKNANTFAVSGEGTYENKGEFKALGGKWDGDNKAWIMPMTTAEKVRAIGTAWHAKHDAKKPVVRTVRVSGTANAPCHKCGTYCCGDCDA